jgi:hypothetical protein
MNLAGSGRPGLAARGKGDRRGENNPRAGAAVGPGRDVQPAAGVLYTAPHHREADMSGLDSAVCLSRVDADAIVVDFEDQMSILFVYEDVDC